MATFDKLARLRKRHEFTKLASNGKKLAAPHFLVISGDPVLPWARLGITVSKKVGNAVSRNRIKRLIREFFRNNRRMFPLADYNIIARSGASHLDHTAVCQELANALSRIGRKNGH
jgi:ribonuclease P protein component